MKLFISGQKGDFNERKLSPTLIKAKKLLDSSKDGELFTSIQLSELLGVFHTYFSHSARQLKSYTYPVKRTRYWGKPTTIKQLIKETR